MLLNFAPVGKTYTRTIEGMGEGLVLFRISANERIMDWITYMCLFGDA